LRQRKSKGFGGKIGRRRRRHPARVEEHGTQATALRERPTPSHDSSRNETGPAAAAQTRSARKNLRTAALFRRKTEASTAARYGRKRAKPGRQNPSAIEEMKPGRRRKAARFSSKTESARGVTRKNHNTRETRHTTDGGASGRKGLARSAKQNPGRWRLRAKTRKP
jgi:hypothetical protein